MSKPKTEQPPTPAPTRTVWLVRHKDSGHILRADFAGFVAPGALVSVWSGNEVAARTAASHYGGEAFPVEAPQLAGRMPMSSPAHVPPAVKVTC